MGSNCSGQNFLMLAVKSVPGAQFFLQVAREFQESTHPNAFPHSEINHHALSCEPQILPAYSPSANIRMKGVGITHS